jgi:hypothetical protein
MRRSRTRALRDRRFENHSYEVMRNHLLLADVGLVTYRLAHRSRRTSNGQSTRTFASPTVTNHSGDGRGAHAILHTCLTKVARATGDAYV